MSVDNATYPNQRQQLADHLYHEWHGYYVLQQATLDLFGAPVIGGGYYDISGPLSYDEALTVDIGTNQALRVVAPGRLS